MCMLGSQGVTRVVDHEAVAKKEVHSLVNGLVESMGYFGPESGRETQVTIGKAE